MLTDDGGLRVNRIENLVRESQQSMAFDPTAMWCALRQRLAVLCSRHITE